MSLNQEDGGNYQMEEVQFEDAESYSSNYMKDKITFRDIILQHLRKISQLSCVEFMGGYYDERTVYAPGGMQNTIKTYVPDTREQYSHAVEVLADLLYPHFDKEMQDFENDCKKRLDESFVKFKITQRLETGKTVEMLEEEFGKTLYRRDKRFIYRDLFRAISSFLCRKKYLEVGSIQD